MADAFLSASRALDSGRQSTEDVGARPYRCYFVVRIYSGATAGEGTYNTYLEEIQPAPKVGFLSSFNAQGFFEEEDALLTKISRIKYTREKLLGLTHLGESPPANETFHIGLLPREQIYMTLYKPLSEPKLEKTAWRLKIRPVARLHETADVINLDEVGGGSPSRVGDGAGGFTINYPAASDTISCVVRDLRAEERRRGEQDQAEITVVVFVDPLANVRRGDRLIANGRTLDVIAVRQPRRPGEPKELDCTEDVRGR